MNSLFAYICTKTTIDPYIQAIPISLQTLARDVSDAFLSISGGYQMVGQIAFFPVQRSVPFHLLCDGREVSQASFPELYQYLGSSQGTPVDPANFVLPSIIGEAALVPAPSAVSEDTNTGTVSTPLPVPPAGDPEPDPAIYGDTNSGGRPRGTFSP